MAISDSVFLIQNEIIVKSKTAMEFGFTGFGLFFEYLPMFFTFLALLFTPKK